MTALPSAPARSDAPATFVAKADAFIAALPGFVTEANALQTDVSTKQGQAATSAANAATSETNANAAKVAAETARDLAIGALNYVATTTASLSLATGSTGAMTIQTGKAFANNDAVVLIRLSDPTVRIYGNLTAASSGSVTMNRTSFYPAAGGGPYTDWMLIHGDLESLSAAVAATVRIGTSQGHAVTPNSLIGAVTFGALTDAATVAWDTNTIGPNAKLLATSGVGASRTMGAPTNLKDGCVYVAEFYQDATGGRSVSWNVIWDFGTAGTPTPPSGANKKMKVTAQYRSDTGKLEVIGVWKQA
jgi:hypothetical protein